MGDYFVGVVGVSKQDSPYYRGLVKKLINAADAVSLAENDVLTASNRDKTHRKLTAAIHDATLKTNAATDEVKYYLTDKDQLVYGNPRDAEQYKIEAKGYEYIKLISAFIKLLHSVDDVGAKSTEIVGGTQTSRETQRITNRREAIKLDESRNELVAILAKFVIELGYVDSAVTIFSLNAFKFIECTIDAARKEVAAYKALDDYTKSAAFNRIPAVVIALEANNTLAQLKECIPHSCFSAFCTCSKVCPFI